MAAHLSLFSASFGATAQCHVSIEDYVSCLKPKGKYWNFSDKLRCKYLEIQILWGLFIQLILEVNTWLSPARTSWCSKGLPYSYKFFRDVFDEIYNIKDDGSHEQNPHSIVKADKCNLRPGFPSHVWLMKMPVKILGLGSCRANVSIHDSWWPWGWDHYHWTRPAWEGGATGSQPRVIEGLDIFWRTPWIRSFNTVIKRILWWWYLRLYGYKKPWLQ